MEDFGFALLHRFFSNFLPKNLFEQLSRTAFRSQNNNKDGVFLLFANRTKHYVISFVHQTIQRGGWLVDLVWTAVDKNFVFFIFSVVMVDAKRMDPNALQYLLSELWYVMRVYLTLLNWKKGNLFEVVQNDWSYFIPSKSSLIQATHTANL